MANDRETIAEIERERLIAWLGEHQISVGTRIEREMTADALIADFIEPRLAALRSKDREDGARFAKGDSVRKVTGDYRLNGIVVGHAIMTTGARRYVVEHRAEGGGSFLHIYAEANLAALPLHPTPKGDGTDA